MKISPATMKSLKIKLINNLNGPGVDHKYHAKRSRCLYGHDHDSKKEAMWCVKLHQLAKDGKILLLSRQPSFELKVNNELIAVHKPDFFYYTMYQAPTIGASVSMMKEHVVEVKGDWSGGRLPVWKLKHKLFCALYPNIDYQVV